MVFAICIDNLQERVTVAGPFQLSLEVQQDSSTRGGGNGLSNTSHREPKDLVLNN